MSKRPEVSEKLIGRVREFFPETKLASNRDVIEFAIEKAMAAYLVLAECNCSHCVGLRERIGKKKVGEA